MSGVTKNGWEVSRELVAIHLKDFNSIRNSMSHSLEPKGIEEKLKKFSERVVIYSDFNNDAYPGQELEFSISWLFSALNICLYNLRNS